MASLPEKRLGSPAEPWHARYWLGLGLFILGVLGTPVIGYLDVEANFGVSPKKDDHGLIILLLGGLITLAGAVLSILSLVKLRPYSSKAFATCLTVFALLVLGAGGFYAFLLLTMK